MLNNEILESIKNSLVKTYNPQEIYLFGSHVWGNPDTESDVDLLVIIDELDPKDRFQIMADGHKALLNIPGSTGDIIVLSTKEFMEAAKDKTRIFHRIKNEGIRIYAHA